MLESMLHAPTALIPWLDPETIISAAGPWALAVVCFIVFAETGLLVGFLLVRLSDAAELCSFARSDEILSRCCSYFCIMLKRLDAFVMELSILAMSLEILSRGIAVRELVGCQARRPAHQHHSPPTLRPEKNRKEQHVKTANRRSKI